MVFLIAQKIKDPLAGGGITDIASLADKFITAAFSFIGILLVALLIYGGYMYMISGGDANKTKQASAILTNAIIGMVIVTSVFLIVGLLGKIMGVAII